LKAKVTNRFLAKARSKIGRRKAKVGHHRGTRILRVSHTAGRPCHASDKIARDSMSQQRYQSFAEFWPYYLNEHSKPATRALHAVGSLAAIASLIGLIIIGKWWLFPLAFVPGYGLAWVGHFFVEKNRPATFTYPMWSFMGDWKMLALMLTGKLE
jgi:hypothetical protein